MKMIRVLSIVIAASVVVVGSLQLRAGRKAWSGDIEAGKGGAWPTELTV